MGVWLTIRLNVRRLLPFIIFIPFAVVLTGCLVPLPYVASRLQTPARHIEVIDADGKPLVDYDLYVYRCTHPGSKCDRVFFFPARAQSDFYLPQKSEMAIKKLGGTWLAPDFYVSYEPKPYWVAAVNKPGYRSRRWSLDDGQGDPVRIVLEKSSDPGEDYCDGTTTNQCNACRSYEYFMYQTMRYRHSECPETQN